MISLTRRMLLNAAAAGGWLLGTHQRHILAFQKPIASQAPSFTDPWSNTHDRVWLGADLWANPMENWRVVDGAAECQAKARNRSIHLLTHQLTDPGESFFMSVDITPVDGQKQARSAGFRVGVRSDINEYRSNSFARGGIDAGLLNGELMLGNARQPLTADPGDKTVHLELHGRPLEQGYELTLTAETDAGEMLGAVTHKVGRNALLGNIALVNGFEVKGQRGPATRYRFANWKVGGSAFTVSPEHRFGPLLWTMYSLSDSRGDDGFVVKLSALTPPLGNEDNKTVELHAQRDGDWVLVGKSNLDTDAWVANFRIPRWNASDDTPFKVVYRETHRDGSETVTERTGTIKANPSGRPLRMAALTCQNDYAFPYEPVANNVQKLDPDLLYFSGDQLYENHGGFGIIREPAEPAILNYLRKFYQFGWAFGDAMRDRPTLCIPDDHDVFQGNIWGEGGAKMQGIDRGASSKGGYRQPARMVNVVHRTCVSHHPDFYDPTPVKQEISVYYGDMVYGNVSFAIIADRQWKSGPERVDTGSGRADHVPDPDFDTSVLDKPDLVLLGERQEEFLRQWAQDWRGHTMKVLLSQTVFAGVATHHGNFDGYLKADLDCGSWPQTARQRAVDILRPSMALHINGDQHLATLSQYGVDKQRDSNWAFCTPAIAAGYPRWWRPDDLGMPHDNRPQHKLPNTGEFVDGLGNRVYVYAVGNPIVPNANNRYEKAHQKGSGFGMVTIDTERRTYYIEAYRFLIDPTDGKESNQFPGWPVLIHQAENQGENLIG